MSLKCWGKSYFPPVGRGLTLDLLFASGKTAAQRFVSKPDSARSPRCATSVFSRQLALSFFAYKLSI